MLKSLLKTVLLTAATSSMTMNGQMFRSPNRMDNMEGFDQQKFSWGFYLAGNNFDYKLVLDPVLGMDKKQNAVLAKSSFGFGAGLIGKMRLHENADLRVEPALHFVQRDLQFNINTALQNTAGGTGQLTLSDADKNRTVKSTYIDIPVMLEVHGDRWYNSRPYAAAGVNYLVNLQSNQKSLDDNQQGIFRTTTHNFGWSVEAGIQFYFSRFKLTPGFRGTFFTNNELVKDNETTPPYWAGAISTAQSRAFMFVLKFE